MLSGALWISWILNSSLFIIPHILRWISCITYASHSVAACNFLSTRKWYSLVFLSFRCNWVSSDARLAVRMEYVEYVCYNALCRRTTWHETLGAYRESSATWDARNVTPFRYLYTLLALHPCDTLCYVREKHVLTADIRGGNKQSHSKSV